METNQKKLLRELTKKLKKESSTKAEALQRLKDAGILNSKGKFTKHYSNLAEAVVVEI